MRHYTATGIDTHLDTRIYTQIYRQSRALGEPSLRGGRKPQITKREAAGLPFFSPGRPKSVGKHTRSDYSFSPAS